MEANPWVILDQPISDLPLVPCIWYFTQFSQYLIKTLISSDNKVNAMQPSFVSQIGFHIWKTDIGMQKIDNSRLKNFGMVYIFFSVNDKNKKSWFLEETLLLIDISINIALEMLFLTLSNIEINFINQDLKWRLYTIAEALSITRQVELIRKKQFENAALDPSDETFVVHVAFLNSSNLGLEIYLFWKVQIASLKATEITTSIFSKYTDFADFFSKDLVVKLSK